jgi:hypothetical protein
VKKVGILTKIIGLALTAGGAVILILGMNGTGDFLSYVFFFIGLLVMSMGFSLMTAGRGKKPPTPPPPTVTEIHCDEPGCDFKEIRDFEKGDYILKPLEARCPKCIGSMTIQGVYIVRPEPEEKEII